MPEYLAPGVYVEEIEAGPPPIAGVSTSTAGFIGVSRRGPTEGRPQLVTEYQDFVRAYGGPFDFGTAFAGYDQLPHALRGFFANGGRRAYIMRVTPASATAASQTLQGGLILRLLQDVPATQATARLTSLRGIRNGTRLRFSMVKDGFTTTSAILNVTGLDRTTNEVSLSGALSATVIFDARYTTVETNVSGLNPSGTVATTPDPTTAGPTTFSLEATSAGSWGRNVTILPSHESAARSVIDHTLITAATNRVPVLSTAGFYAGAWVEIDRGDADLERTYRRVDLVDGSVLQLAGGVFAPGSLDPVAPMTETRISTCEFGLTISYEDPAERTLVNEQFGGLTLENVPGRFYVERLRRSQLVRVPEPPAALATLDPFMFPAAPDGRTIRLTSGGLDGTAAPTVTDFRGTDLGPNRKTGMLRDRGGRRGQHPRRARGHGRGRAGRRSSSSASG